MSLALFLPWFPIVLAVGVGGRLLGRRRGLSLGLICAFFWVVLTQSSASPRFWQDWWNVLSVVAGAFAIAAMGAWAGDHVADGLASPVERTRNRQPEEGGNAKANQADDSIALIGSALERFDGWLEEHRDAADPWPAFGEFIRSTLYDCCRSTHVKPYRLSADGWELVPLRKSDSNDESDRVSARGGIVGHVLATGRDYHSNDPFQGELIESLVRSSSDEVGWCFAVRRGERKLGVVTGRIDPSGGSSRTSLVAVQRVIGQCWRSLEDALRARVAQKIDPVSELLTLRAFLGMAVRDIEHARSAGEPVACVVIALEGLRRMADAARWDDADEFIRIVSQTLRGKVRADDRLGRLDGSRFVLLLRRVDADLATLIVRQIVGRLQEICGDRNRWKGPIHVRCGLATGDGALTDLRAMVAQAMARAHEAREQRTSFIGIGHVEPVAEAGR